MAKPAASLEPGRALDATLIEWGKDKTFYRVHHERFRGDAFNPTRRGNARFSPIYDPSGAVIPTLYAGSTLDCALMETVFHDVPYKPGFKRISLSVLDGQVRSVITFKRNLQLIDLGTIALHKLAIKRNQLIDTTKAHYPRTRRWAEALYKQVPKAQGLRWTSRQDDRGHAVLLFGSRIKPTDLDAEPEAASLIEEGEVILPVLDLALRLGVVLVD
ncbi:RES family NAD+ phosphorylase [Acidicapsa ligni]|uniref:RES family NAD+ phosphorylase n=1 Tax=Acidicapsa ligni TaxID=542300 RepID=UPI0021DFEAA7|nr:RES family NAD+ phosphorylase [Acidicapsa ligni]